mmetsp:Transcript_45577/g.85498  ORF Transcript_45577/g.85498 Transcript_45577/m.85498 type:complete len:201 (+) Transcript_45577:536-1138(+)
MCALGRCRRVWTVARDWRGLRRPCGPAVCLARRAVDLHQPRRALCHQRFSTAPRQRARCLLAFSASCDRSCEVCSNTIGPPCDTPCSSMFVRHSPSYGPSRCARASVSTRGGSSRPLDGSSGARRGVSTGACSRGVGGRAELGSRSFPQCQCHWRQHRRSTAWERPGQVEATGDTPERTDCSIDASGQRSLFSCTSIRHG